MNKFKTAVVFGSYLPSLINFRKQLLLDLQKKGFKVVALAPGTDSITERILQEIGVTFISVPLSRTGFNPITDFHSIVFLRRLFNRIKPDLLITYTIKPVIYGNIAFNLRGKGKSLAWITGLGYLATGNQTYKKKMTQYLILTLYKFALRNLHYIAFQNSDDKSFFCERRLLSKNTKVTITAGSGVDLCLYPKSNPVTKPITFLLVARLIKAKGINEYFEAAKSIKKEMGDKVRFCLIGMIDTDNPDAISEDEIKRLNDQGIIEYFGFQRDIRPYLGACSVFVLPSYYREGTPRTILEALAMGKPIITTDNPGCRETIIDGQNGFKIPVKNARILRDAMMNFVNTPMLIERMGSVSYQMAMNKYDVHKVNAHLFKFIGL